MFRKHKADPIGFSREVLGLTLNRTQEEIASALVVTPQVAAPPHYGGGAKTLAAVLTLWWISCSPAAHLDERTLRKIFWGYSRKLRAPERQTARGLRVAAWQMEPDRTAVGVMGLTPETLESLSSVEHLLLIEDAMGGAPELPDNLVLHPTSRHLKIGSPVRFEPVTAWLAIHPSSNGVNLDPYGEDSVNGIADWDSHAATRNSNHWETWRVKVFGEPPVEETENV